MSSLGLLILVFYKTEQEYYKDRPAVIYVIAPRRSKKEALDKARILEKKHPQVEIKILYEGKDKDRIDQLLDLCLESKRVVSPSIW